MAAVRTSPPKDWLRWISLALTGLGALDAAYLSYIKLAHVEAICRGVGNCEAANSSVYAEMGGIPIAVLGLAAYLAILVLLLLEPRLAVLEDYAPLAVFGLALTGTLYSAYLTYVELFVIHAICPFCATSAVLISGLFILAVVRLVRGPLDEQASK